MTPNRQILPIRFSLSAQCPHQHPKAHCSAPPNPPFQSAMKLNNKNKGKVYPSPSSSFSPLPLYSTAATATIKDTTSALKLLPAAIFTLISVLSLEDREVLAYMIARSIKATANPSELPQENRRRRSKQRTTAAHTPPVFDCGCFDCYTSYWFRWDSSPNRELIHQAIEAFEDHLASGEQWRKSGRGKRRDKIGRPSGESATGLGFREVVDGTGLSSTVPELLESSLPEVELPVGIMQRGDEVAEENEKSIIEVQENDSSPEEETVVGRTAVTGGSHKGLARKVLPDVIGMFNSRLWSLWSPSV